MSSTLICVTLRGHSIENMIRDASRATAAGADLVEVRFDNLYVNRIEVDSIITQDSKGEDVVDRQPPIMDPRPIEEIDVAASIEALKDGIQIPVIFTCRATGEGGQFHGDEASRATVLAAAIESGVSWVDIEVSMEEGLRSGLLKAAGEATKIIASAHLQAVHSAEEILEQVEIHSEEGSLLKFCFTGVEHGTSLHIFEAAHALAKEEKSVALMARGPGGDWTRIHAPLLKQPLVYTTLDRDYSLFQRGQVNINDLRTAWRLLEYE
jgi:3-dehydroquinate dehydratase type I